jgi:Double-GTPase 1
VNRSIVLLGGPDSGKTNYIGRLWRALDDGTGTLHAAEQPDDINFVLEVTTHLFEGDFAPRSEHRDTRRDFEVVVAATKDGPQTRLVVPDTSGELWRTAAIESEIDLDWMDELRRADGALLFVRVGSDQDVRPLDWVTSRRMLEKLGGEDDQGLPTQVMLCELIRFLEVSLAHRENGELPRLSVVVTAWDLVDEGMFQQGPIAYLEREYPLVAGRLADLKDLDVRVFGLSVVGGDLKYDAAYRKAFLEEGLDGHGWVAVPNGDGWRKDRDMTLPIAWPVGL